MKNILITIIVTVALLLHLQSVSNGNALFAQFGGGDGTQANPYQIATRQHLEELKDSVENSPSNNFRNWSGNKYFIVTQDITDTVRTIIGEPYAYFQGNFNGNGFKIVLDISSNSNLHAGLFGEISSTNVDSISISNITIEGYIKKGANGGSGGIVGFALGTLLIKNCESFHQKIDKSISLYLSNTTWF